MTSEAIAPAVVSIPEIFNTFLKIGATSFGGGIVAHLRSHLVVKHQWLDDKTFVELLAVSQTLPGLNAANMAILIGDRLRGTRGALAAIVGVCLPGAIMMYLVGLVFKAERDRPLVEAALDGVAAAAVGLILATTLDVARKTSLSAVDIGFVLLTVVCVNGLNMSVPRALIAVGLLAVIWSRRAARRSGRG